jgi:hypothetical protein
VSSGKESHEDFLDDCLLTNDSARYLCAQPRGCAK